MDSDGSFGSFPFIPLSGTWQYPHRRQSEPCNAPSLSRVSPVTLLTVVVNSTSEDDYVKSGE